MNQDELAIAEYKICHDGYMSRDGLVPTEFSEMLRTFVTLVAISAVFKLLMNYESRLGGFLFLLIALSGFCCLIAFAVNIEAKASSKRALRKRMVEIEEAFNKKELPLQLCYWKSIVGREKSWLESTYKHKKSVRKETGSASCFFVVASRVLVCVWIILQIAMYLGNVDIPRIQ